MISEPRKQHEQVLGINLVNTSAEAMDIKTAELYRLLDDLIATNKRLELQLEAMMSRCIFWKTQYRNLEKEVNDNE